MPMTSDIELETMAKGLVGKKIPAIMRDQVSSRIKTAIVNLDDSSGGGTHWVAYHVDKDNAFYCDSFGALPPQECVDLWNSQHKKIIYNELQFQDLKSTMCGFFALGFVFTMVRKGKGSRISAFKNFLSLFDYQDKKKNDQIISEFLEEKLS